MKDTLLAAGWFLAGLVVGAVGILVLVQQTAGGSVWDVKVHNAQE